MTRRSFVRTVAAAAGATCTGLRGEPSAAEIEAGKLIQAHRPSVLAKLPADFCDRVGATHVDGKYFFGGEPFLVEGAKRLLAMGTRLGKFWFQPLMIEGSYRFNHRWPKCATLTELARTEYFRQVFEMPFRTIMLECMSPRELEGERGLSWRDGSQSAGYFDTVSAEYEELTAHLYRTYRDRRVTFILQNWEGDWILRGGGGRDWKVPPADWKLRCEGMARWFAARQAGVSRARAAHGAGASCVVAHAAEVNKVAEGLQGVPNLVRNVLPQVEVDLVSYSAYDGMKTPQLFWRMLAEIRKHTRTGALYGPGAVCVGEIGIPEVRAPERIAERWDELMGVMLAAKVTHIAQWELYCNEFQDRKHPPKLPVTDGALLNGYWLVKPDGSLSETGAWFQQQWRRAG